MSGEVNTIKFFSVSIVHNLLYKCVLFLKESHVIDLNMLRKLYKDCK